MNARVGQKPIEWPADGHNMYSNASEQLPHIEVRPELCTTYTYRLHFGYRIRQGGHGNILALGITRSNYTVNYPTPLGPASGF
jgi:hypothetical protein